MMEYRDFAPTSFDTKGAFLPERQDWLVAPVSITRDSGPFSESNFSAAVQMLGGEGDNVEIHRFGHWGPGWFEIILVRPNTKEADIVQEIEDSLNDYALLDESDYSEREFTAVQESWEWASMSQRVEDCREAGVSIFAARSESFPYDADVTGYLWEQYRPED